MCGRSDLVAAAHLGEPWGVPQSGTLLSTEGGRQRRWYEQMSRFDYVFCVGSMWSEGRLPCVNVMLAPWDREGLVHTTGGAGLRSQA